MTPATLYSNATVAPIQPFWSTSSSSSAAWYHNPLLCHFLPSFVYPLVWGAMISSWWPESWCKKPRTSTSIRNQRLPWSWPEVCDGIAPPTQHPPPLHLAFIHPAAERLHEIEPVICNGSENDIDAIRKVKRVWQPVHRCVVSWSFSSIPIQVPSIDASRPRRDPDPTRLDM